MPIGRFSLRVFMLLACCSVVLGNHRSAIGEDDAVARLAAAIDRRVASRWQAEKITPSTPATDAEFMRRVYLDIGGKIPPVSELREFLVDTAPDKRRKLVDRLLASPNYVAHFTSVWRTAMIPEVGADIQARFLVPGFEAWLRERLTANTAYDEMVREVLTVPLNESNFNPYGRQGPSSYYRAKQFKPENLAASVSRTFLGVRIECAQCHDHPFDQWKRNDFWSFAAFFSGVERRGSPQQGMFGGVREKKDRREIEIPETDEVAQAAFLDGGQPKWRFKTGARTTLAEWLTSKENPYFARAAANRIWARFFGIGLVDPIDDFGVNNPPSHPELLDELAAAFVEQDFDLKFLMRAITASQAYGLSSKQTDARQQNPGWFARAHIRQLTSEQVFRSLSQATGHYEQFNVRNQFDFSNASARSQVFEMFNDDGQASETPQLSILQALGMMNGLLTADATSLEESATLAAIAEFPLATSGDRVEAFYLAALSRKPTDSELARMVKYVDSGGPRNDPNRALADVFWALLNSSEFIFNH